MDTKAWLLGIGNTIDAKDSVGFANYLTEEGIFRFGNQPDVKGRKDVAGYVAAFFNMIKSSEHEIVNFWQSDGSIIWQGLVHYTRLDGRKVDVNFCNVFYMKGELIDQYLIYIDNTPLFAE
jgi:hypothetical protein